MKLRSSCVFLGVALATCLLSSQVEAHWCNDLWGSAYNLVVRPESDTITVPSSGSANMTIYVQNNMEYALPSFKLVADIGGTAVTATRETQKVSGTLLPGEKAKYTLAVTKSGGGTVNITDIDFSVTFGSSGQDNMYGENVGGGAKAAMIKKTDGTLFPTGTPPGIGTGNGQGTQLYQAAVADFGNTNDGLDKLLQLYCSGRGSWNSGSNAVIKSNCPDTATTVCPTSTPTSGNGSKFDYMHLWSAGELGVRKSALGARATVLRQRLQCGVNDANTGFAGFALMVLGYLGEDAGARTFIEGKIGSSGDLGTIAKCALVLMGNADDLTKYKSDITTAAASSSIFVKASCSAALGIAAKDDGIVSSNLIPLAKWTEPDTSDNGQAIYAAQVLNLVAWDRRGWAPGAGDTGAVSFYGETASGGGGSPGTGGRPGTGGSQGTGGRPGTGGGSGSAGASGSGGNKDGGPVVGTGGSSSIPGSGGATVVGSGGRSGPGSGGATGGATTSAAGAGGSGGKTTGAGGVIASGGVAASGGTTQGVGGSAGSGGGGGDPASGGAAGGGEGGAGGDPGTKPGDGGDGGCKCNVGGQGSAPAFSVLALMGLALVIGRRRRR